jgi:hypothetical protein
MHVGVCEKLKYYIYYTCHESVGCLVDINKEQATNHLSRTYYVSKTFHARKYFPGTNELLSFLGFLSKWFFQ